MTESWAAVPFAVRIGARFKEENVVDDLAEQLLEAWHTNNRINLFLIREISDEGMATTLSTRGGRNVTRQFAHLHNNRVWQLEKRAPDLAEGLHKFETQDEPDKETLIAHLEASGEAIARFLSQAAGLDPSGSGGKKRKIFKKGVLTNLAYLIAHDSHHRGNILLTLKQTGHNLSQATRYAIWNWDKM